MTLHQNHGPALPVRRYLSTTDKFHNDEEVAREAHLVDNLNSVSRRSSYSGRRLTRSSSSGIKRPDALPGPLLHA